MNVQTKNSDTAAEKKAYKPMSAARFARLKPATQRIRVAQDVIQTLNSADSPKPTPGTYFSAYISKRLEPTDQLKKSLPSFQRECRVCAIGALFISHIHINNAVTVGEAIESDSPVLPGNSLHAWDSFMRDKLKAYFPIFHLGVIENAFEGFDGAGISWRHIECDPTRRLHLICENIIRNKGDFDIMDLPK